MNLATGEIVPDIPQAFRPLWGPGRYKVCYGGRDGAKSWSIARTLLIMSCQRKIKVGCFREIQKSIRESVHALLKSQIELLGLSGIFDCQETRIVNLLTGSEFVFAGLRTMSVENIKSFEGLDVAWIEEARNVSKRSWDVLIPTIRKPGSQIWVSFNPELETDETYTRFVKGATNDNDIVLIPVSWRDNPWRSEVLDNHRRDMERNDPDGYLTVYEGRCRQYLDGAIYASEIRLATAAGRICRVPYEPMRPVHTFWDLGWSDATAIWLVQFVGFEKRIIGYIEDHGKTLDHYVQELQRLPYVWGTDWLPHDARAKSMQTGRSHQEQLQSLGRDVRITPGLTVTDGINAARQAFGQCWFDQDACREGLNRLRSYCYEIDDNGQRSKLPLHDDNSHGADAFRYFAVAGDQHGADRAANINAPPQINFVPRRGIV